MDELRRIKFKRALPGVVAGAVLFAIMLFLFYSMTPDQRMKRALNAVFSEHGFVRVGETSVGRTTTGMAARIDVYEAPRLAQDDYDTVHETLSMLISDEYVDPYTVNNPRARTYVITKSSIEIAEIRLMPFYRNDEGHVRSRLIVRRHASFDRSLWQLIFG